MAIIKINMFSKYLMRTVEVNAIIPADKIVFDKEISKEKPEYKTLYLLHGIFGDNTDWLKETNIKALAEEKNLAVIMPSGENKFYIDNEYTMEYFSRFIGEELVEFTRKIFPLSCKKEDTFIAGLSMGGYGAIVNGLKYNNTFGYIAGLSSALLLEDIINSVDGDDVPMLSKRSYYRSIFGDLDKLIGSDKDYKGLIKKLKENNVDIPQIYMACGTEDFLINKNREFRDFLIENNVDVKYEEGEGIHNWEFWGDYIKKVLQWFPLDEGVQGIGSGNVKV